MQNNNQWINYGWVCPLCKRALSPTTTQCPCYLLLSAPVKITDRTGTADELMKYAPTTISKEQEK